MSECHRWPAWYRAWQPPICGICGKGKPRKLKRLGPDAYRIVSVLPGGGFVSIPIGRFDLPPLPPR